MYCLLSLYFLERYILLLRSITIYGLLFDSFDNVYKKGKTDGN